MPIKKEVTIGDCRLILGDCLEVMPLIGAVDAILTDPPYGIDFGKFNRTNKLPNGKRYKANKYKNGDWDKNFDLKPYYLIMQNMEIPTIIWGGNYFPCLWELPSKGIIFWNKNQPCKNFSAGELAWSNLDIPAKYINYSYFGNIEGKSCANTKEHPTQKPIEVMRKCLNLLPSGVVLDMFMGSGTTGVACAKMGRRFVGIEIDETYFNIAVKRITDAYRQPDMFTPPVTKPEQLSL